MASAERVPSVVNKESGAVILEVAASILVFFLLLFGIVEFAYVYYQWNSATMATAWGARLAAVSSPVAPGLSTLTGLEGGALPGSTMPAFNCVCDGAATACTSTSGTVCGTYDSAAMGTILYGRGYSGTTCVSGANGGMCKYWGFPFAIDPKYVKITYQYTGMGYAGRQAGPIPTITVALQNVSYKFIFLDALVKLTQVNFPVNATSTETGEDLKSTGS